MMCMMCCLYAVLVNAHCVLSMWDAELLLLCCLSTAWMCRVTTTPATPLDSSGSMRSGQWEPSVWAWASVLMQELHRCSAVFQAPGTPPSAGGRSEEASLGSVSFGQCMSTSGASWVCESHVFKADTHLD